MEQFEHITYNLSSLNETAFTSIYHRPLRVLLRIAHDPSGQVGLLGRTLAERRRRLRLGDDGDETSGFIRCVADDFHILQA